MPWGGLTADPLKVHGRTGMAAQGESMGHGPLERVIRSRWPRAVGFNTAQGQAGNKRGKAGGEWRMHKLV